jgi:hypothetical protein
MEKNSDFEGFRNTWARLDALLQLKAAKDPKWAGPNTPDSIEDLLGLAFRFPTEAEGQDFLTIKYLYEEYICGDLERDSAYLEIPLTELYAEDLLERYAILKKAKDIATQKWIEDVERRRIAAEAAREAAEAKRIEDLERAEMARLLKKYGK